VRIPWDDHAVADDTPLTERGTVAAGYDALVTTYAEWSSAVVDPARDDLFADFVRRLPTDARVLDVGCGSGSSWTAGLATRFALTGIDISPGQIEAARRNVPSGTFLVADVTTIDFDNGAFDGATALYSIGHLPAAEHESVFARLARWLRPDGLLLASLPAQADPGAREVWIAGVEMFFASLGAARYEQILHDQGWRVISARVVIANEPGGPAAFFWVLAGAPGRVPDKPSLRRR
jgi:SAM-dependent methyltransferase